MPLISLRLFPWRRTTRSQEWPQAQGRVILASKAIAPFVHSPPVKMSDPHFPPPNVPFFDSRQLMAYGVGDNLAFPSPEAYMTWLNTAQPPPIFPQQPGLMNSQSPIAVPPPPFASSSTAPFKHDERSFHTASTAPYTASALPEPTPLRRSTRKPKIFFPSPEYLELSKPVSKTESSPANGRGKSTSDTTQPTFVPKLLVLDLNGALIYRAKGAIGGRRAYPRPYLGCFLEYVFAPEPDFVYDSDSSTPPKRPWEVFVWSSAQPQNVRGMVEACFGKKWCQGIWDLEPEKERRSREQFGEGRLLGVWARDKMGLSETDYHNKVQTVKDLRTVLQHLQHPDDPAELVARPPYQFDERTTFLIDDSPLKGVHQPWNQLVIPEYDRSEYTASQQAALISSENPEVNDSGMDEILLGVIGILEATRAVDNIPAWVRSGGLDKISDELTDGVGSLHLDEDLTFDSLPSHESFRHWYQTTRILAHWIEQGKQGLKRKGIELRHGLDPSTLSTRRSTSPRVFAPRFMRNGEELSSSSEFEMQGGWRGDSTARVERPRTVKRYSPSRPASAGHEDAAPPTYSPTPSSRASRSPNPPGGSSRRGFSTVPVDSWRPSHNDAWRTFRAADVCLYLKDLADRPSPLDQQHRTRLLEAAAILASLGPDQKDEQRASGAELHKRGYAPKLCDKCTLEAGIKEAQRINAQARQRAIAAGMVDMPNQGSQPPRAARVKGTARAKRSTKSGPPGKGGKAPKPKKKKATTPALKKKKATPVSKKAKAKISTSVTTGANNEPLAHRASSSHDTVKVESIEHTSLGATGPSSASSSTGRQSKKRKNNPDAGDKGQCLAILNFARTEIEPWNPYSFRFLLHSSKTATVHASLLGKPITSLVAVKQFRRSAPEGAFEREVDMLNFCRGHASFVQVVNYRETFIVMEQYRFSLSDYVRVNGALTPKTCLEYTFQLFSGLRYLHDHGIVHNSIRPDHLLLDSDMTIRITGLGSAFHVSEFSPRQAAINRTYTAPEALLGAHCISASSDMWSAGCVLAEMLQGAPFFKKEAKGGFLGPKLHRLGVPIRERTAFRILPSSMNLCGSWPRICYVKGKWRNVIPRLSRGTGVERKAVCLLLDLLQFNPSYRPSARSGLALLESEEIDTFYEEPYCSRYLVKCTAANAGYCIEMKNRIVTRLSLSSLLSTLPADDFPSLVRRDSAGGLNRSGAHQSFVASPLTALKLSPKGRLPRNSHPAWNHIPIFHRFRYSMDELPIFLHPLKLIPHYYRHGRRYLRQTFHRGTQYFQTLGQNNDERLFGRLEQLVTAVVVLGLALQPPQYVYAPVPEIPTVPVSTNSTLSTHNTTKQNFDPPPTAPMTPISFNSGTSFLNELWNRLPQWLLADPATAFLVLMGPNVVLMLLPSDLKRRMKESWALFWPPWQDRTWRSHEAANASGSLMPEATSDRKSEPVDSRGAAPRGAEWGGGGQDRSARIRDEGRLGEGNGQTLERKRPSETELAQLERERQRRKSEGVANAQQPEETTGDPRKRDLSPEEIAQLKARQRRKADAAAKSEQPKEGIETEGRRDLSPEELDHLKSREREKRKAADSAGTNGEGSAKDQGKRDLTPQEMAKLKEMERQRRAARAPEVSHRKEGDMAHVERSPEGSGSRPDREKLSQSETARRAKSEGSGAPPKDSSREGKGKQRSDRSGASTASTSTPTTSTSDEPSGASAASATVTIDLEPAESSSTEKRASSTSDTDADDPLMAGDYRPLRSAMKKTKKKPRQTKNIHHNYFMTMRGWRPSLVPFPHGFHPKPYYPRNTLWWDNVPKNVDHIMAPPPVAKVPEELRPGEDKEEAKIQDKDQGRADEEKAGSKESKANTVARTATSSSSESSGDSSASTATTRVEEPRGEQGSKAPSSKESSRSGETGRERAQDPTKSKAAPGDSSKDKTAGRENVRDGAKGPEKDGDKGRDKEKERERAMMLAKAEEEANARAKAQSREGALPASSARPQPNRLPMDPQLQKAMYVSQGMLSVLVYAVSPQLGLLVLIFFVWQFVNTRGEAAPPPPIAHSQRPSPGAMRSEATPMPRLSRGADGKPGGVVASKSRDRAIPPEMQAKLDRPGDPQHARERDAGTRARTREGGDDSYPRGKESAGKAATNSPAGTQAKEEGKPARRRAAPGDDARGENGASQHRESENGRPKQRTLDDLTPEQRERYLVAKARREKGRAATLPPDSGGSRRSDTGAERQPKRLEDLSEEDRARYMEERARRKRLEREKAARHANGAGGSGLTADEKDALASS